VTEGDPFSGYGFSVAWPVEAFAYFAVFCGASRTQKYTAPLALRRIPADPFSLDGDREGVTAGVS
jgi:hypothetical protein